MAITATKFRTNLYHLLQQAARTGLPFEVALKTETFRIVPLHRPDRLAGLKRRATLTCDPEKIVHIDWSDRRKWEFD